jgi:hypothetical protein
VAKRDKFRCVVTDWDSVSEKWKNTFTQGTDGGHVFVPRALLPGRDDTYHEYNIVLMSNTANLNFHRSKRLTAAKYLVKMYGVETIQKWIDGLGMKYPVDVLRWMSSLE